MEPIYENYLLKGDLSGIQEFIFDVRSKGAAKTLKARSYYVQILGYLACKHSLHCLNNSSEFFEGGGAFFVRFEAVNNQDADSQVNNLRRKINGYLMQDDLLINLAFVHFQPHEFGKAWAELNEASNRAKTMAFGNEIDFFTPFVKQLWTTGEGQNVMPDAAKHMLDRFSFDLDSKSNIYAALTDLMVKKETILIKLFDESYSEGDAQFDGSLSNKLPFWKNYDKLALYQGYRKNIPEVYPDNSELENLNIVDFDALGDFAAHRTGTNKIAILKLDVDNLGKLFRTSEIETAKDYSKRFSDFFGRKLYEQIFKEGKFGLIGEEEEYNANIYPVFSGGDDCLIIGGWDAVLCFARDLHKEFARQFKDIILNGSAITLSAGIVLVNPTHPVTSFAELAELALGKAKAGGKNAVSLFNLRFEWKEFENILDISKIIAAEMSEKSINRAYLDKIRKSAKGFNALQNRDGANFDRIYKLKYYLSKNDTKLGIIVEKLFEPYYETLKNRLLKSENGRKYSDVAVYPAIARIAEFLTKKRLEYGK